jgi:TonB family protein
VILRHEGAPEFSLKSGVIFSVCLHVIFFIIANVSFGFGGYKAPVVYSIEIESGSRVGGVSQKSTDPKTKVAPPTAVQKKAETKKVQEQEKIPTKQAKEQPKKVEQVKEKKPQVKPKEPKVDDLDKRLASAVQRYKGASTSAGGIGFGSTGTGGAGMGGGVVRPPEFFTYKDLIEEKIKSGWRWFDTRAALSAQVEFSISPQGKLSAIVIASSSKLLEFDESALRAVAKADPLPPPPTTVYRFFARVRMTFDPRD